MGVLAIFSTGTYATIGTMCVESETCYEKYPKKLVLQLPRYYPCFKYWHTMGVLIPNPHYFPNRPLLELE